MPRYANAPIIEAIIDIRVRMPKDVSFDRLKSAQAAVSAAFTEAMVPPPQVGVVSVVLDIEVSRQNNPPQTDTEIWSYFEKLRERKNQVFEASITDAARELIS